MMCVKELEYFMQSLMVVSLSKSIGYRSDGTSLISEERMCYLNNCIKGNAEIHKISETDTDNTDKDDENPEIGSFLNDNSPQEEHADNSGWVGWCNTIWDSAIIIANDSQDGNVINACYNPEFARQMKSRLLPYLPIWTGVMRPHFNKSNEIASSSAVESEFNDLKSREFKGQLPMRVDKFIMQHLNYIDSKIILACNENDTITLQNNKHAEEKCLKIKNNRSIENDKNISITDSTDLYTKHKSMDKDFTKIKITHNADSTILETKSFTQNNSACSTFDKTNETEQIVDNTDSILITDESFHSSDAIENEKTWNIFENWHGLAGSNKIVMNSTEKSEPKRKKRKETYLDSCPEWDFIKNMKSHKLPLIINGSKCKEINKQGSIIIVHETCAFDAILQIVVNNIATHTSYREATASSFDDIFKLARSILENGTLLLKHYAERASILENLPLFRDATTKYTRKIRRLNANCNVTHLSEYLFKNEPSYVVTKFCTCGSTNSHASTICNINVDILLQKGLQYIQRAIEDVQMLRSKCRTCGTTTNNNITYGTTSD